MAAAKRAGEDQGGGDIPIPPAWKVQAQDFLIRGQYQRLVGLLLSIPQVKREIMRNIGEKVQSEVATYSRDSIFSKDFTIDSLQALEYEAVCDEVKQIMPTVAAFLQSAMPSNTSSERNRTLTRTSGICSVIAFDKKNACNLLQKSTSFLLKKHGCHQEVIKHLNHLGYCLDPSSSLAVVDKVFKDSDAQILESKRSTW